MAQRRFPRTVLRRALKAHQPSKRIAAKADVAVRLGTRRTTRVCLLPTLMPGARQPRLLQRWAQLFLNYVIFLRTLAAASASAAQADREKVVQPHHVDAAAVVRSALPNR